MKLSPKRIFQYVSLAVIAISWIAGLISGLSAPGPPPPNPFDLVMLIVRNKIIVFLVVFTLLWLENQSFSDLGFTKVNLLKQIGRGVLFGMAIFILIHLSIHPLLRSVLPKASGQGINMAIYFNSLQNVLIWLLIGMVGGGFVEEFERIFVLTRFQRWLGKSGLILALIISSVLFGMGHYYQGLHKAIGSGLTGLMFGLVYLRKGSATEAVTAHAMFDTIGIVIGYLQMNGH